MNIKLYMDWPCRFVQELDGVSVTIFNDGSCKELTDTINTCGSTTKEAENMAVSAIIDTAEYFFERRMMFPKARSVEDGDVVISIPLHVALKIALHNIMISERYRAVDIYKNVEGGSSQKFNQDMKLRKVTKFETLAKYFCVVGHNLNIEF